MSKHQKLEQVLDLLLSENQDKAADVLHQIIVEKARVIYESIVEQEEIDFDEVDGDDTEDFTAEISSDEDEIDADQENDGEVDADELDGEEGEGEGDVEDRVEDLEAQLAELRAEFDALMDEEMDEPNHADLAAEIDGDTGEEFDDSLDDGGEDPEEMFERRMNSKLKVAPQAKKAKQGKKVDEETQFLNKVADTGQRGTAKLVGTGNKSSLGAENNQSPYTRAPSKKDYGGKPVKIGAGTGGEPGKYHGETAKDETPTDNVGLEPKKVSAKADSTSKYTGGKAAGDGGNKSPLSKKP